MSYMLCGRSIVIVYSSPSFLRLGCPTLLNLPLVTLTLLLAPHFEIDLIILS